MKTTSTTNSMTLIKNPHVTEKASAAAAANVYTFDVSPRATKNEIKKAIKAMYKVTPVKVNMVTIRAKAVTVRGKQGMKSGGKKAMVYLKEGDKIEIA